MVLSGGVINAEREGKGRERKGKGRKGKPRGSMWWKRLGHPFSTSLQPIFEAALPRHGLVRIIRTDH
jgi:hypothetical protein